MGHHEKSMMFSLPFSFFCVTLQSIQFENESQVHGDYRTKEKFFPSFCFQIHKMSINKAFHRNVASKMYTHHGKTKSNHTLLQSIENDVVIIPLFIFITYLTRWEQNSKRCIEKVALSKQPAQYCHRWHVCWR